MRARAIAGAAVVAAMVASGAGACAATPVENVAQGTSQSASAVTLAPSYSVNFDNLTFSETSTGSLTDMSVNAAGAVSGQMTVNPPLFGTSALSGTLTGSTLKLTGSYSGGPEDFTGTVSGGQISGTYNDPGVAQNGTWTATPLAASSPTPACSAAIAAYQADETKLDNLLAQLRSALASQASAASNVALIMKVQHLLSVAQADDAVVGQRVNSLNSTIDQVKDTAADFLIEKIRVLMLNTLDPEATTVSEDLANTLFQRTAAEAGEGAVADAAVIDAIGANAGTLGLAASYVVAIRLGTADAALKADLDQLIPLQAPYLQVTGGQAPAAALAAAQGVLASANANVNTLTSEESAVDLGAALTAMTQACKTGG